LSHFLFVIVMEDFSRKLSTTVNGEFLSGFFVGSRLFGVVNISHLLFADSTLVCCGAKFDSLHYLHALFLCFESISDLKINLAKSELVPLVNVDNVDGLASILSCRVSSLPLKYFGLALGPKYRVSVG
jgi:hypothetical protein